MEFFVEESCGQCTPCRIGNVKLLEGVDMIEKGELHSIILTSLKTSANQCKSRLNAIRTIKSQLIYFNLDNFKDEIFNKIEANKYGR